MQNECQMRLLVNYWQIATNFCRNVSIIRVVSFMTLILSQSPRVILRPKLHKYFPTDCCALDIFFKSTFWICAARILRIFSVFEYPFEPRPHLKGSKRGYHLEYYLYFLPQGSAPEARADGLASSQLALSRLRHSHDVVVHKIYVIVNFKCYDLPKQSTSILAE